MTNLNALLRNKGVKQPPCVVRVRTECWYNDKGLYQRKNLTYLKRKGDGYDDLKEEVNMIGADEVFPRIINLDECEDGIYQVVVVNMRYHWEDNSIDNWDYKLVPFKETK